MPTFPTPPWSDGDVSVDGGHTYHDPPGVWKINRAELDADLLAIAAADNGALLAEVQSEIITVDSINATIPPNIQTDLDELEAEVLRLSRPPGVDRRDASAGDITINATESQIAHITTAAATTVTVTNAPYLGATLDVIIDVDADADEVTFTNVAWGTTAPVLADFDAGTRKLARLTYMPGAVWFGEWYQLGVTPDPSPSVTPPTLTAFYSTSADRSSPTALSAATLPVGDVYVFFGPTDDTNIEKLRIFINNTTVPADGAETTDPTWVRTVTSAPFDLIGGNSSLADPWDTTTDPTGNANADYDPNGSNTIKVVAHLIDGTTTTATFTFDTANAAATADMTYAVSRGQYTSGTATHPVTVPAGVDRVVVVHAHACNNKTGDITGITLGGAPMTITDQTALFANWCSVLAVLTEADLTSGTQDLALQWTGEVGASSKVAFEVVVMTNAAEPVIDSVSVFQNHTLDRVATLTSVPANAFAFTSSSQQEIATEQTVTGTGLTFDTTNPTLIAGSGLYLGFDIRSALDEDTGSTGNKTATWDVAGKGVSMLTAVSYSVSDGGDETPPIIPATPVASSTVDSTDYEFTATWAAATDAVSYQFQHGTTNPPSRTPVDVAALTRTVSGLDPATYYWQVRGVSSTGHVGAWSTVNASSTATVTGTVTPPPAFSGKFLVSTDPVEVCYVEGGGAMKFNDINTPTEWERKNAPRTEYGVANIVNNNIAGAISRWQSAANKSAFKLEAGPRLIVTSRLVIGDFLGAHNQNLTSYNVSTAVNCVLDMAKTASTGSNNRDATFLTLAQSVNRTVDGFYLPEHVLVSVSHEANGYWMEDYWGTNTDLIGQPALLNASALQYGSAVKAALTSVATDGLIAPLHKLAVEHVIELMTSVNADIALGMSPSDGKASVPADQSVSNMSTAWVYNAFPDVGTIDFISPTMYFRNAGVPVYDGSGDVEDPANYTRQGGFMEYGMAYAEEWGVPFGFLEFGGDYAIPGELTPGAGSTPTDNEMLVGFKKMMDPGGVLQSHGPGLAFINQWLFYTWEGAKENPGASFHPLEGNWGRLPTGQRFTSSSQPSWSTSGPAYPKTVQWFKDTF